MNILPVTIFYSYAKEDERYRIQLEKHLSLLKRQGKISGWHFRMITGGKEFKGDIDQHLNKSRIILLLVSADFLSSDYCYDVEMNKAMTLYESGAAIVIPIILRSCDWQTAPFGKLQALPKDGTPITKWPNLDDAFLDIVQGIKKVIQKLNTETTTQSKSPPTEMVSAIPPSIKATNTYCARCGIKAGTKSECTNLTGEHSFKSYTGDVYCTRCGIKAGTKSECTNLTGEHSFKSNIDKGGIAAYCITCRKKRIIEDPKIIIIKTANNNRNGIIGTCPFCGKKLFRLLFGP